VDVDEQVRVAGGGPGRAPVVEVGAQPVAHGVWEQNPTGLTRDRGGAV
jgi:hypothetical protein